MDTDESRCEMNYETQIQVPGIAHLPEACVVLILKSTSPRDAARLACVSRAFREMASLDFVWGSFLPNGYSQVIANTRAPIPSSWSKKHVYHYLCKRLLIHDNTQEFWLDQNTGGVCRTMCERSLRTTWGDHEIYWHWLPRDGSSYAEVGFLKNVCWLEIKGDFKGIVSTNTFS